MSWAIGEALAEKVSEPQKWIEVFSDNCDIGEIVAHLLGRLYRDEHDQWLESCRVCWANHRLRRTVAAAVLVAENVTEELLNTVVAELPRDVRLVEIQCLRRQVAIGSLRKLFTHEHDGVAAAAAWGEWNSEPRGQVRPEVQDYWRPAILRCGSQQQRDSIQLFVGDILASDSDLAFDWLLARIREGTALYRLEDYDLDAAVPTLSPDQRLKLLSVLGTSQVYAPNDFIQRLVGSDVQLYRQMLADSAAKRLHLSVLNGRPSPVWAELAISALDAGYSPAAIQDAADGNGHSWSGDESAYWEGLREAWQKLAHSEDVRLKETARLAIGRITSQRDQSIEKEKAALIYGES